MIKTKALQPTLTLDDVDVYLPRGIAALEKASANPRGLFRIFQRHPGARFFGLTEYLSALASIVGKDQAGQITVWAVPEGYALARHETAMTLEGPAQALLVNETLLHYLTTGTRARTLAGGYPAKSFPWVFMGARYLAGEDLAIFTRALAAEGILSTVPRWADKFIGTESHSQIVMWGGLRLDEQTEKVISDVASDDRVAATIRATVAFARANPRVPLYVLGDFAARSLGCAEVFRATDTACRRLGLQLAGGRMDISKCDLNDVPIFDKAVKNLFEAEDKKLGYVAVDEEEGNYSEYHANKKARQDLQSRYCGMGIEAVRTVRRQLDEAGMKSFKLVVSSGIKLDDIKTYAQAGASMVGIGEEAAYYLNQGQCNYTSDAIGYFEGDKLIPFAKEGRELSRLLDPLVIDNAHLGVKIAKNLERHNLADYL